MTWRTKSAIRAKKFALASFLAGRPLELLAAVSVTWSSLIFAMLDYPVQIRTMVTARAPPLRRNSLRRADRTRTCNLRFWRPLRYQLRHYPLGGKRDPAATA